MLVNSMIGENGERKRRKMWFRKRLGSDEYQTILKRLAEICTTVETLQGKFNVLKTDVENLRGRLNRKLGGAKDAPDPREGEEGNASEDEKEAFEDLIRQLGGIPPELQERYKRLHAND